MEFARLAEALFAEMKAKFVSPGFPSCQATDLSTPRLQRWGETTRTNRRSGRKCVKAGRERVHQRRRSALMGRGLSLLLLFVRVRVRIYRPRRRGVPHMRVRGADGGRSHPANALTLELTEAHDLDRRTVGEGCHQRQLAAEGFDLAA